MQRLTRARFPGDFIGSVSAVLIGLYATLIPFIVNPRFYFNDDEQNQHYAYYIDIGQHLRHHQWPWISLSTFYGGNLVDDWQYGLFNPFSLLIYWIICSMQNLLLLGLFLFAVYLTLLALGGYWLGRVFGLRRIFSLSVAAGLVTNNFLQYVYCDSWSPGLVSFTWFIWTWVFLEQYRKRGRASVLAGLICVIYLTITSGWPHTLFMLGILMLGYFVEIIVIQRLWNRALKLVVINIGALLLAAPFFLPALLSFSWMYRPSGIHSSGLFMPDLGSVLNLSSIFFYPRIHLYGHEYPSFPMMYLAWFILPLLPLCSWQMGLKMLRKRLGIIIFATVGTFFLFGPENLGPIRYPMRFLPFIHTTVLLAFFLIISLPGIFRISKLRLAGVLIILFMQFTASVSVCPDTLYLQMAAMGCSMGLVLMAARLIHFNNIYGLSLLMLSGTVIIFSATHFVSPKNTDLVDFNSPIQNNVAFPTVTRNFSGYQLYIGPLLYDNARDVRIAAQGIYTGVYTINGYSALGHAGLNPQIHGYCWFEMRDRSAIDFLLSQRPPVNRSLLSLMRVNRLLIYNGYFEYARPLLGADWIPTSKGEYATVLENATPNKANTTLSFASDGIVVKPHGAVTGQREQLQIVSNANGGELVFARLYWPGYEALLDGKPLAVSPFEKVLVKVDLQPGSQGEFVLRFVPPGLKLGLILAGLGSVLCCAAFFIDMKEVESKRPAGWRVDNA